MCSRVKDVVRVATALDLEDLLASVKATLREMGLSTDLDAVNLGTQLNVGVIKNTVGDGSHTLDLRVVPVEIE